ncbi:MAG: YqaA family protein [Candidatus Nanoarchaeia archaeon]
MKENRIKGFHLYAFGLLRKLYDWVLSWAEHKYGTDALFGLSFAEASFFPVPPDPLQIALSVSKPKKSFWYALVSMVASVLGGLLGYAIGVFLEPLGRSIINYLGPVGAFETVGQLYADNAFWAIFASALSPIPYKVFTISAGIWSVNIVSLVFASILGRGLRFFAVAALLHFFGPKVKDFIDRYFNILTLVFLVLFIGGFYVIKYVL